MTRPTLRSTMTAVLLVTVAGILTGVLTLAGQSVFDGNWNRLANSGAVWVTVAFLVGTRMTSDVWAGAAGLATLVLAVLGYQVAASVAAIGMSTSALVIWTATALVGGPAFGVAGRWWRAKVGRPRAVSSALLGAVYVAEGLNTVLSIAHLTTVGWIEIVAGVVVAVALARTARERGQTLVALVPLSALGLLVYRLIEAVFSAG